MTNDLLKLTPARTSIGVAIAAAIVLSGAAMLSSGCSPKPVTTDSTQVVDGLKIEVTSDPPEPHTGDNNLEVNIHDAKTGLPLVDANVAGTVKMTSPTLPGVIQTGRSKGNGLYEIPVSYPTATSYDISIEVDRPGHEAADFNLSVEAEQ